MNLLQPKLGIDDLIWEMMSLSPSDIQLTQLQDWVERLELKEDLLQKHIRFSPHSYQRHLLCRASRFDLLILCWQPGQISPIHDHGDSLNVTRVCQGILTSRTFETRLNSTQQCPPVLKHEECLQKNELATVEQCQIHQLANTSDENLVTLHIYAHPLNKLRVYCPLSGEVQQVSVYLS